MYILITFPPSVAPGDYGTLMINIFCLGPFNYSVRQLSFNASIMDDNIPEDAEMFSASLTLDPAAQARLGNRVMHSSNQNPDGGPTMLIISGHAIQQSRV